jgi:sulfane dehydrogenase subunit SoxC
MAKFNRQRRKLLKRGALLMGGGILSQYTSLAQKISQSTDPSKIPGGIPSAIGTRSTYEKITRQVFSNELSSWSYTPLEHLHGIITPSDLHFERHHGGIPEINPADYTLIVHGMVDEAMKFNLNELKRFPSVSRICFIECSGNGYQNYWRDEIPKDVSAGELDGLISTSEWTGVPLRMVLNEAGIKPGAKWLLAEGQDAAKMTRSIPLDKALDDALLVYGQNGEALRPGMGYPLRLLLPGWEGNTQIKWLRRIEVSDSPYMTREETSKYSDATKDGRSKLFTFRMATKSVITSPCYPQVLNQKGYREISGMAWSGNGKIAKVEVSTDGGRHWFEARLQLPILDKCPVRFNYLWNWQGEEAYLLSRATDELGEVQPMPIDLQRERGDGYFYHNNSIRPWKVSKDGSIQFALDEFI